MSATIFGTDGVRGTPGQYPLDERTIARLGAATVRVQEVDNVTLLVALDTRESGPWVETQLARGVTAQRGHLVSAGIIPTPAAALLAATQSFDAALVISASHNPFPDNGIKLLTGTGEKASLALEARVEALVADESWTIAEQALPSIETRDLSDTYVAHAAAVLAGIEVPRSRVAVDCGERCDRGRRADGAPQLGFDVVHAQHRPRWTKHQRRLRVHPPGWSSAGREGPRLPAWPGVRWRWRPCDPRRPSGRRG